MLQAIFLDRDGVINRERADYVKNWKEFEFLPGVLTALRTLQTLNLPIIVLTNQSAIGRGLVSEATVNAIHIRLQQIVKAAGGRINDFYICPHHPQEGCACRKPRPGLLLQAAADYSLNLPACIFIGDSLTDHLAAEAAGCRSIMVASGRQGSQLRSLLSNRTTPPLVPDLAAAVSYLRNSTVQ